MGSSDEKAREAGDAFKWAFGGGKHRGTLSSEARRWGIIAIAWIFGMAEFSWPRTGAARGTRCAEGGSEEVVERVGLPGLRGTTKENSPNRRAVTRARPLAKPVGYLPSISNGEGTGSLLAYLGVRDEPESQAST